MALGLRAARRRGEVQSQASGWLDLLRLEIFPTGEPERSERIDALLAHFAARGWLVEGEGGMLAPTAEGGAWLESGRSRITT